MESMNIIIAGVGGQGILSIAFVLDNAAMSEGFRFKQAEVHGMSQRGGAVQSHLRFSKSEIYSDLIPEGKADLILSVEPLEALRYYHFLKPEGAVVSSLSPFVNIPNYPDPVEIYRKVAALERHSLIDSQGLAKAAGSPKAENMVMLGAASYLFPFQKATYLKYIEQLFGAKGEKAVKTNQAAFEHGDRICSFFRNGLEAGLSPVQVRVLCAAVDPTLLDAESLPAWKEALDRHPNLVDDLKCGKDGKVPGTVEKAREVLEKGAW